MSDCILWAGRVGSHGYGLRGSDLVHRLAYVDAHGSVPDGYVVHHECGTKLCVNPAHLRAITHAEHNAGHLNAEAWYERQRAKTHCPHGHEYTDENTMVKRGKRHCRTCERRRNRDWYARQKVKA